MDSSSACRIAVRVPQYVEVCNDGSSVVHRDSVLQLVVDRDTTNLKDLIEEISEGVKLGTNQGISICFWNRTVSVFMNVTSDAILMDAMDLYWEMRRLALFASVYDTVTVDHSQSESVEPFVEHVVGAIVAIEPLPPTLTESVATEPLPPTLTESVDEDKIGTSKTKSKKWKRGNVPIDEEPWDDDEMEYVGLNDEHPYLSDGEDQAVHDGHSTDGDSCEMDDLFVDDAAGCEEVEHVTDLENPTIAVGVTFEDGDTFKRAIKQYAVLHEFEIHAHYSEAKRYRGNCKGKGGKSKKCRWRIHASELQDGKTWQVMIPAFNCVKSIFIFLCDVLFVPWICKLM